jgi:hypothetical protein
VSKSQPKFAAHRLTAPDKKSTGDDFHARTALIDLVRLIARQAARESAASPVSFQSKKPGNDKT